MSNIISNFYLKNSNVNIKSDLYCFKGTKSLKTNFSDEELKIKNNIREFRTKENNGGYDEIFLNEDSEIFGGVSRYVSFLYPPKIRGYQNRIGFRFYKEEPISLKNICSYFTLVKIGIRTFIILEKESDIRDFEGNFFKIEDLDCIDIMKNIIRAKLLIDKDGLNYPNSMVELLGIIYASRYKKNISNNIYILHPFIPNPFIKESMIEEKHDINFSKFYIEPILYNKHISLLVFNYYKNKDSKEKRNNIIFDMSLVHYKRIKKDDPILSRFKEDNISNFPRNSIQIGGSCSLWFIGTLLFLLNEKINIPFTKDSLYKIIDNIYDLLDYKERDICLTKIGEREEENIDEIGFFSYKLTMKSFIDVDSTLIQLDIQKNLGLNELGKYQKAFLEIKNELNLLEINRMYYKRIFNKETIDENSIIKMKSSIEGLENIFLLLIKELKTKNGYLKGYIKGKYSNNHLHNNIKSYRQDFKDALKELKSYISYLKKNLSVYSLNEIREFYFDEFDTFLNIMDN